MANRERAVSLEQSNGTSFTEGLILMPVSHLTSTHMSPDYAGLNFLGLIEWRVIEKSLNETTIDITLTASCARNLGMALIMEARQIPLGLNLRLILRQ